MLRPELLIHYMSWARRTTHLKRARAAAMLRSRAKKAEAEGGEDGAEDVAEGAAADESADAPAAADGDAAEEGTDDKTKEGAAGDDDKAKPPTDEELEAVVNMAMPTFDFNANAFTPYATGSAEQLAEDEMAVRELAAFLSKNQVPTFVRDIQRGAVQPLDSAQLVAHMHDYGINSRYLGHIVRGALADPALAWLVRLALVEMVARLASWQVNSMLRDVPQVKACPGPAIATYLNCLLGSGSSAGSKPGSDESELAAGGSPLVEDASAAWAAANLSPASVWAKLTAELTSRYNCTLKTADGLAHKMVPKLALLRRLCLLTGLLVSARDYDFTSATPVQPADLSGFRPVVYSPMAETPSRDAAELTSAAQLNLRAGRAAIAQDLAEAAVRLAVRSCGQCHRQTAGALELLATILDSQRAWEEAAAQQETAVRCYERLLGADNSRTINGYVVLGSLLHGAGQTHRGMPFLRRAASLLALVSDSDQHPLSIKLYTTMARFYARVSFQAMVLPCLHLAHAGARSNPLETIRVLHEMADAYAAVGRYGDGLRVQREVHSFFKRVAGEDDRRTKEAHSKLKRLAELTVAVHRGGKPRFAAVEEGETMPVLEEVVEGVTDAPVTSKKKRKKRRKR
eukprot:PLAT3161.1.p1 GENE.PLAT3161.1~~PLAT3161.1.p1  ORF type:complete len:717 (-),score=430.86 PLAT3161.1:94-1977(-)